MDFGQLLTAMVTPFNDKDEVDLEQTTRLVHFLIDHGSDGLVVAGTTGESATLSIEEKLTLFEHVVKVAKGRATVIAGTGGNDTKASVELTKEAEKLGVDGVMVVAPYYNRPDQSGLYEHFKTIANATSLPVMIYNIPGRSAVNIEAETIIKLSEIDNVVSVKEASGNLAQMSTIVERTKQNFTLYSGDDGLTIPVLSIGGYGVVSVASHIIGKEMKEMITSFKNGEIEKAASLHRRLLPVMQALFKQPSPAPVKAALTYEGIHTGSVRLPLVPLNDEQKMKLHETIQSIKKDG